MSPTYISNDVVSSAELNVHNVTVGLCAVYIGIVQLAHLGQLGCF